MRQLPHDILFLSPLNFEMPCLAIADNPRNPRLESVRNDREFKSIRDLSKHIQGLISNAKKRYRKLFNLEISVIYVPCFSMSFSSAVGLSKI